MKRIVKTCFCAFIFFTFIWAFYCDRSCSIESIIDDDFISFSLVNEESAGEKDLFRVLSDISKQTGKDIIAESSFFKDGEKWHYYFKTSNEPEFINISTSKGTDLLGENECFTNAELSTVELTQHKLNTTADANIAIFPFEQLSEQGYVADNCLFYCKEKTSNELFASLEKCGFEVTSYTGTTYSHDENLFVELIFATLYLTSVILFTVSEAKKIVLMKMDGCSCVDIVADEIFAELRFAVCFIGSLIIATVLIVKVIIGYPLLSYIRETAALYKTAIYILILSVGLRLLITASINKHKYVKGAVPLRKLYVLSNLIKSLSLIGITVYCIYTINAHFLPAYYEYKASKKYLERFGNRVSIYQYGSIEQTIIDDQNKNLYPFYKDVCENHDAIYIDSSEYAMNSGTPEWKMAEQDKPRIDVNENYLDSSYIYDLEGNRIKSDSLDPEAFNVLIPNSASEKDIEDAEAMRRAFGIERTNLMIYDAEDYELYSYRTNGIDADMGMMMPAPDIYVYDYHIFESVQWETSQILYGKLYIRTQTDDPEKELMPLIKKYDLEKTIDRVSSLNEQIEEYLRMKRDSVIYSSAGIVLATLVLIWASVFSSDSYCKNNSLRIAIEQVEGMSTMASMRNHLIMQTVIYVSYFVIALISTGLLHFDMRFPLILITATIAVDFMITYVRCQKQAYKNLYQIIKGDK